MERYYFCINVVILDDPSIQQINSGSKNDIISIWDKQMNPVKNLCDCNNIINFYETDQNTHFFVVSVSLNNKKRHSKQSKMKSNYMIYGFSDTTNFENYYEIVKNKLAKSKIKIKKSPNLKIYVNENLDYIEANFHNKLTVNKPFFITFIILIVLSFLIFSIISNITKKFESNSFSIMISLIISLLVEWLTSYKKANINKESIMKLAAFKYDEHKQIPDFEVPNLKR